MSKIFESVIKLKKDGFFHILVGNILVKLVAFISSIVVVRIISKVDYACLTYADNIYSYITLLSGLGLSTALLKFCSPQKGKEINKYYYVVSVKYGLLFQIVLSLILVIIVSCVKIPFENARPLIYMSFLFPFATQFVTTLQSFARSQLNNRLYANMGIIQTIITFVCSITLTFLIGVKGVIVARYLAMAAVILVGVKYVKKIIPSGTAIAIISDEEKKYFWKISISLMMANLFSMIMPINETYLINHYIRDEIITANFKVATLIPSQITFITSSVIVYSFPKVSQLFAEKKHAFKYTLKVNTVLMALIGIIVFVGYFFSPLIIHIVYGDAYADAIELSKIYWIAYGTNAGFRMLPMSLLPAFGVTTANSLISVTFCVLHALLLFLLIPTYGIYGAAYTSIIIYVLSGMVYWLFLFIRNKKR